MKNFIIIILVVIVSALLGNQAEAGKARLDGSYAPRLFFNAKFESRDRVLHGAGQDHESFLSYREALGSKNRPAIYMEYVGLGRSLEEIKAWGEEIKAKLAGNENAELIPQIGISMGRGKDGLVSEGKIDSQIEAICQALKALERPVFVRIGYEFEGSWNNYSPDSYRKAFIRIARALKDYKANTATVWCAAGGSQADVAVDLVMEYYPGDEWVDWWAIDTFSPKDINLSKTHEFLDQARLHHKPVMIGEATPRYVGVLEGEDSWERWFAPFFKLIRSRPEIKAFCYINWDWEYFAGSLGRPWGNWGDARIQMNSFVLEQYQNEMSLSLYEHSKPVSTPNILFIAVDDLRLQTGFYGETQMHTPHMDKLAESSIVFKRAYCSVPVCGASRASLMSGARPTESRFVNYYSRKDRDHPDVPSLSYWFKSHGYRTIANGKIYHVQGDDFDGWTESTWWPEVSGVGWQGYLTEESKKIVEENRSEDDPNLVVGPCTEAADVPDNAYTDGGLAEKSVKDLRRLAESGEPFFLAVGFLKPHLPFNAPQKYWNLYDRDEIDLPTNGSRPRGSPDAAMHNFEELRFMYADVPEEGPISEELALELIHGYYACVSYTDAQIGKVLKALEQTGLADNTIVVLWGDHGWHLGEHGLWCKHANFDLTMKAPLVVRVPGLLGGIQTSAITEFIDIYPTLCELTGLPLPSHLDGKSFASELKSPDHFHKEYAYSRYHSGESIISKNFAYSQWGDDGRGVYAKMLYDHQKDPEETENVVDKIEYFQVVEIMKARLAEVKASMK